MHTEFSRDWVEGYGVGNDDSREQRGGQRGGEGQGQGVGYDVEEGVKVLSLTKSPIAAPCQIPFKITSSGLEERTGFTRTPR